MTFIKYYNTTIRKDYQQYNLEEMPLYGIKIKHLKGNNQIIDVSMVQNPKYRYMSPYHFYAKTLDGSVLVFDDIIGVLRNYNINILLDNPYLMYFTFKDPIQEISINPAPAEINSVLLKNPPLMIFTTRPVGTSPFSPVGKCEMYEISMDTDNMELIKVCQSDGPLKLTDNSQNLFYRGNLLFMVLGDKINYYKLGFNIKYIRHDSGVIRFVGDNNVRVKYIFGYGSYYHKLDFSKLQPDDEAIVDDYRGNLRPTTIENGKMTHILEVSKKYQDKMGITNVIKIDYNNFDLSNFNYLYSFIIRREM